MMTIDEMFFKLKILGYKKVDLYTFGNFHSIAFYRKGNHPIYNYTSYTTKAIEAADFVFNVQENCFNKSRFKITPLTETEKILYV